MAKFMKRLLFGWVGISLILTIANMAFGRTGRQLPDASTLRRPVSDLVARMKGRGAWDLSDQPMFPYKGGLNKFTVYTPQTWGAPLGVFIDSYDYFRSGRLHLKVCFDPLVVQNIKIPNAMFLNNDWSGVDRSPDPEASEAAIVYFQRYPCRLLLELLQDKQLMAWWVALVGTYQVSEELLNSAGMDKFGKPLNPAQPPQTAPAAIDLTLGKDPEAEAIYNMSRQGQVVQMSEELLGSSADSVLSLPNGMFDWPVQISVSFILALLSTLAFTGGPRTKNPRPQFA